MATSRDRKQVAFVIGLLAGSCLLFLGFLMLAQTISLSRCWPFLVFGAGCLLGSVLYVFGQGSLPSSEDVALVAQHICTVREEGVNQGRESFKASLRFYLPPDWHSQKVGKEGWVIYPKGLGTPLTLSLWAFDSDPSFDDSSQEGLLSNANDLADRMGFILDEQSVLPCQTAGQDGISFSMSRGQRPCAQGYLWKYESGDYLVVVEASGKEHLRLVMPAIDEFLCGLFMW